MTITSKSFRRIASTLAFLSICTLGSYFLTGCSNDAEEEANEKLMGLQEFWNTLGVKNMRDPYKVSMSKEEFFEKVGSPTEYDPPEDKISRSTKTVSLFYYPEGFRVEIRISGKTWNKGNIYFTNSSVDIMKE